MQMQLVFLTSAKAMHELRRAFDGKLRGDPAGTYRQDWTWPHDSAVSFIGPRVSVPATHDKNGEVIVPAVLDMRCHVNVRTDDADAQACLGPFRSGQDNGREWG